MLRRVMLLVVAGCLGLSAFVRWDARNVTAGVDIYAENVIFDEGQATGEAIIGWIYLTDTPINQPITQGEDNDYFLRHNFRGEYSVAGNAFLDYRNRKSFEDDFSIVYGHRMSGDLMFGGIKNFAQREYFEQHLRGDLRVGQEMYELRVVAYAVIGASDELYGVRSFANGMNEEVVEEIRQNAINWNRYDGGGLILLSTCDANLRAYRNVLLVEKAE